MKTKITCLFAAFSLFLALTGCKPTKSSLAGGTINLPLGGETPSVSPTPDPQAPVIPAPPPVVVVAPPVEPPPVVAQPIVLPVVPTPFPLLSTIEHAGSLRLGSVSRRAMDSDAVKMVRVGDSLIFFTIGKVWRMTLTNRAVVEITPSGYNDGYPSSTLIAQGRSAKSAVVDAGGDFAVIFGGSSNYLLSGTSVTFTNTGWVYRASMGSWRRMNMVGAPATGQYHGALAGTKLMVWNVSQGAVYDLTNDSWTAMPASGLLGYPRTALAGNTFVAWTRRQVCFQSRENCPGQRVYESRVRFFNPETNSWRDADAPPVSLTEYCSETTTPVVGGEGKFFAVCAGVPNYSAGNMPLAPFSLDVASGRWTAGTSQNIVVTGLGSPLLWTGERLMLPFSDRGSLPGFVRSYDIDTSSWSHTAVRTAVGSNFHLDPPEQAVNPFAGDQLYLTDGLYVQPSHITLYSGGKLFVYSPVVGTFYIIH